MPSFSRLESLQNGGIPATAAQRRPLAGANRPIAGGGFFCAKGRKAPTKKERAACGPLDETTEKGNSAQRTLTGTIGTEGRIQVLPEGKLSDTEA